MKKADSGRPISDYTVSLDETSQHLKLTILAILDQAVTCAPLPPSTTPFHLSTVQSATHH